MKTKCLNQNPKTFAIIFDSGDEVMAGLAEVAKKFKLASSRFTAIGAFKQVTLGFFDIKKKDYKKTTIREQLEVLSLIGDISLKDAKPQVHAHVVVGRANATTRGGHLLHAIVRPTLEVMLVESPVHLRRTYNSEFGLALITFSAFRRRKN